MLYEGDVCCNQTIVDLPCMPRFTCTCYSQQHGIEIYITTTANVDISYLFKEESRLDLQLNTEIGSTFNQDKQQAFQNINLPLKPPRQSITSVLACARWPQSASLNTTTLCLSVSCSPQHSLELNSQADQINTAAVSKTSFNSKAYLSSIFSRQTKPCWVSSDECQTK